MKFADIKKLIETLENNGVTNDFDITFRGDVCEFDEDDSEVANVRVADFDIIPSNQPFDIGFSDKVVSVFIREE